MVDIASWSVGSVNLRLARNFASTSFESPQTRACTFFECLNSGCDPIGAPFTCLFHNGGPHGGCSPTIWTPETCSESCDLSECAEWPIPDSLESCEGSKCSPEWCQQGQLCGKSVQYQCTEGPGRFGCSDDQYHWVLYGCSCCDVNSCDDE